MKSQSIYFPTASASIYGCSAVIEPCITSYFSLAGFAFGATRRAAPTRRFAVADLGTSDMPTVISHAVAAASLMAAFPQKAVPRRLLFLGAACSMAPDVDVIGFGLGIGYSDLLGHRGLTHSLLFAAALAFIAQLAMFPRPRGSVHRGLVWLYLFLATASHGLLDAITDGGLGVAFFSPFDTTRYFFPFTPVKVFSSRGFHVLLSEFQWVWLPSFGFAAVAFLLRRFCRLRFRSTL